MRKKIIQLLKHKSKDHTNKILVVIIDVLVCLLLCFCLMQLGEQRV